MVDYQWKSSKLAKKHYWDEIYSTELTNFQNNDEDRGEVWFGESVVDKIVNWIGKLEGVHPNTTILDVGCGNGHTLFQLENEGYLSLSGIDYSESAILLAQQIAEKENVPIHFQVDDILNTKITDRYHIVMDKGTFDVVSLFPEPLEPMKKYSQAVFNLLDSDPSYFIITSCNFTHQELLDFFQEQGFCYFSHIKYPTITFGGQEGSTVTTIAFKKRS